MVAMRHLILLSALVLAGCVAPAIQKTDDALKARLDQLEAGVSRQMADAEKMVSRVKTEAVDEAKKAASELVTQASKDLQKTGEALIDKAADRSDALVKAAITDATKTIDDQRVKVTADLREVIKTDVPKAVGDAVVGAADKIVGRLGIEKTTVPGKDGIPMEVWVLGGSGLAGFLGTYGKSILRFLNRKKEEERDEEWFEKQMAKRVGPDGKVKVAHAECASCSGPASAPPSG